MDITWKCIEHSRSKVPGKHAIVVGYTGKGGPGSVVCAIPLYDLRDYNFDGSISVGERLVGSGWWPSMGVDDLVIGASEADFKIEAGRAAHDIFFSNAAVEDTLRLAYSVAYKAAIEINVKRLLMPGVQLTLAASALKDMEIAGKVIQFVVKTAVEKAVIAALT
ncbi:MAG: hypothetical protein R2684_09765 [Pyrinomonadaceae bacterium]